MPTDSTPRGGSQPVGDRVRVFRRGRTYHVNYQFQGRQVRRSLHTGSLKEARRQAVRLEAELAAGGGRPAAAPRRLEDAVADYLDFLRTEQRSARTLTKYEGVLRRLLELAARRGARTVADVGLKLVDAYRSERVQAGRAAKTVYNETGIIRQLVNFSLSRSDLAADPLQGLKARKPRPTPQPCWTRAEVERILAASPAWLEPALRLLAELGLRVGELTWLTWDDVDLGRGFVQVRPKDGWRPKTGDRRSVPLSPAARRALEALPRRSRWVVAAQPTAADPAGARQASARHLLAALKRVLKPMGLPGHLHTFRHAFISHALMHGTPESLVRAWVGHTDPEVIKLYTHVHDSASQAAMQRLARANVTLQPSEVRDEPGHDPAHAQHSAGERCDGRGAK